MNVALVCPYAMTSPGGVQEHVNGLARHLSLDGHRVVVYAPGVKRGKDADGVAHVSLGGTVHIPTNGSVAPIGLDPRMLVGFEIGLDAADVVHIHEPFLPAGLAAIARCPRSVPIVGTFHASAEASAGYALASPLLKLIARRLRATTAVSPSAAKLVARYLDLEPQIIANGIDVDSYLDVPPDPWASGLGRVALFVGRPEARKGFTTAVRAFTQAAYTHSDLHFVSFPGLPGSEGEVDSDLRSRIHCLGRVSPERKRALYASADVAMFPATGSESFGIVLLEAFASSTAVIASDIPGYRTAGGDCAIWVDPTDQQGWTQALCKLLDDDPFRRELQHVGPDRAREFDWSHVAGETLKLYQSLLVPNA